MNLYRLEWMKLRLSTYLWAILGIFTGVLSLGILFLFIFQIGAENGGMPDEADLFADWNGLLSLTTALSFACFSVFSAVLSSKVIVSEYCRNKAVILLTCPVRRTDMLRSKCLFVCGITALSAWAGNMLVTGIMYLTAQIFAIGPQTHSGYLPAAAVGSSALMGLLASQVGILSAAFGYARRSPTAAVVCSLLFVCTTANLIVIAPERLTGVLMLLGIVLLSIACPVCRTMADRIKDMEV